MAGSDQKATVPTIEALCEAGHRPEELVVDTNYSSASNAAEAARRGVNLLAPARGKPEPEAKCPQGRNKAGEWLRRQEAQADFKKRYAIRAGIEGTNSELKRVQGLGKLRVRREKRVKLAVYLKAAGCNLRRALRWWTQGPGPALEGAASLA